MFGTSGVRGETNTEITPMLAMELSYAFGKWLGGKGMVVMARDTRFGAQMLTQAITAGLNSAGLDVLDCGIMPTPALALSIIELGGKGGVMVTGSHMPPNRIGLIYMDSNACYISDKKALEVEELYFSQSECGSPDDRSVMNDIGIRKVVTGRMERYMEHALSLIDREFIAELTLEKNFRIVLDPGNGTAVDILPAMVKRCGIKVAAINNIRKGNPDRSAEPRATTLDSTINALRKHNAKLAAATDVDADRVVFIDEEGKVVSEDVVGAIFGKWIFEKCADEKVDDPVCITPVNSSGLIDYLAEKYEVKMAYCRIGQPDTERALMEHGDKAVYAYEESGKYYFAKDVHWCDGNLATLFLLQIMAERKMTLAELADDFPDFYQAKGQRRCSDQSKDSVYASVVKRFNEDVNLAKDKKMDITIDGLKRIYNDNSWLLVRPSGTEPLFRVYSDAMSRKRADFLLSQGEKLIDEAIKDSQ